MADESTADAPTSWTFLSNHGHVLVAIKESPDARLRELAARVGISERAVQLIVRDLERAGYVVKERSGRRNHYIVTSGPAPAAPGRARVVGRRPAVHLRLTAPSTGRRDRGRASTGRLTVFRRAAVAPAACRHDTDTRTRPRSPRPAQPRRPRRRRAVPAGVPSPGERGGRLAPGPPHRADAAARPAVGPADHPAWLAAMWHHVDGRRGRRADPRRGLGAPGRPRPPRHGRRPRGGGRHRGARRAADRRRALVEPAVHRRGVLSAGGTRGRPATVASAVAAEFTLAGRAPLAARETLERSLGPDEVRQALVAVALAAAPEVPARARARAVARRADRATLRLLSDGPGDGRAAGGADRRRAARARRRPRARHRAVGAVALEPGGAAVRAGIA